jgi:dTDP-4-amino-4,6-dideoxy-D-galactose acyltransferase
MIQRLDWDSSFFGYEVGKIWVEKDMDPIQFKKEAQKFHLVYVYSQEFITNLPDKTKHVVTQLEWEINLAQNFSKRDFTSLFDKNEKGENGIFEISKRSIFESSLSENLYSRLLEEVEELAILSGEFSRFNLDTQFRNNEFNKLYIQWIRNAVWGEEKVLVYRQNFQTKGIITLGSDARKGRIGLIAVSEECRGKGIGKQLLQAGIELSSQNGQEMLQIGTQKINLAATGLYQKMGFHLSGQTEIYHWWNG